MHDVEESIRHLIARQYRLGTPADCRLVHGGWGINDTWSIDIADRRYALRLQPDPHLHKKAWVAGEADLRFELELLVHLHNLRVPVARSLPRRNHDLLGRFETPAGERIYTLFAWATGRTIDVEHLATGQARLVGQTIATVHVAADQFRSPHPRYSLDEGTLLDRPLRKLESALGTATVSDIDFIGQELDTIRVHLRAFDPGPGGWGIIHGDVQGLNYHLGDDGEITLFDFDLCGYGWRAYDVAYYVTRIPARLRQPFLDGYASIRPLSYADLDMLETFGKAAWIWEGLSLDELIGRLRQPFI